MKKSAIVIVDMQNEFCVELSESGKEELRSSVASLVEPINNSIAKFRKSGAHIIWLNWGVEDSDLSGMSDSQLRAFNHFEYPEEMTLKKNRNSGMMVLEKESWSASIISDLNFKSNDTVVNKTRMSGFWHCTLNDVLIEKGIKKIYFAGVNTDQCVMTTLQDAYFAGYEVSLIRDCTSTLSPQFCFDATIYNIQKCFGDVVDSRDLE